MLINEERINLASSNIEIPRRKALVIDGKCINIVSDRYKVVQPKKVIETFEQASGLTITNQMTNHHTGGLLIQSTVDHPVLRGEEHKIDVTFYTGHDGKHKTFVSLQALRIACMNQVPALSREDNLHLISTKHFEEFNFDKLKEMLGSLPLHMSNFKVQYEKLHDTKYTKAQFLEDYIKFFKIQEERKDKVVAKVADLYSFAQGQETITNDSAFKAYQAVTYELTHNARNGVGKMEQVNIKNQKTAKQWFDNLAVAA